MEFCEIAQISRLGYTPKDEWLVISNLRSGPLAGCRSLRAQAALDQPTAPDISRKRDQRMADFTPHEAPAHEAQALPVMLASKHIGRDRVLGRVYQQLKDNMPVLLYGPAGVGKTALAGELASA